jgi:hypothetical protein
MQKVVRTSDQVASELSGETVILSLRNGVYYGLDEVGSSIWRFIEEPRTFEEIRERITAEYDVTDEECAREVERFVGDLRKNGLVDLLPSGV